MKTLIESQLINALKKRFSITTEIINNEYETSLVVNSILSGEIIFQHKTDLNPLIEIITKRIKEEKPCK